MERYQRQTMLNEIGIEGQMKLKNAKVLVVGSGGLGAPVLQYLCAAGIGTIGIIDNDEISESNLQRQILFSTTEIGKSKVDIAKQKLEKLNPNCKINAINDRLDENNASITIAAYDVIVDCTDNFRTRYLLDHHCEQLEKPMVFGSIEKFGGQLSVFHYKQGVSYHSLFPDYPEESILDGETLGVLGAIPGVIGSLQATEVIKIIAGIGEVLSGVLLVYNALNSSFQKLTFAR